MTGITLGRYFNYVVIGVWKTGNEVSDTYDTLTDAMRRVKQLRQHPAIQTVQLKTFQIETTQVNEEEWSAS